MACSYRNPSHGVPHHHHLHVSLDCIQDDSHIDQNLDQVYTTLDSVRQRLLQEFSAKLFKYFHDGDYMSIHSAREA